MIIIIIIENNCDLTLYRFLKEVWIAIFEGFYHICVENQGI